MTNTVFITGATRGIGLELSKQYAKANWKVLACSRHPETPDLQALKNLHSNVSIVKLDVSNQDEIKKVATDLRDTPIDLLINCAGIYGNGKREQDLEDITPEDMEAVFKTNSIAPLMVSRAFLPQLELSRFKTIVTISSRIGSITDNTSGEIYAYRTSKAAVNMIMKSLAVDLSPKKIKVILLHPGWVKTDMGGAGADIDVSTSVEGMRRVIESKLEVSTPDTEHLFFNYKGEAIPW